MKSAPPSITVTRGETRVEVIFRGSRRPMSRRDLHVALEPIFRAWIRAACSWDGVPIGDHKFVVFMLDVAPETQLYVQFWSEPLEPVLWEVSSGRWNPPADEWLAGDRARRIEAMGFAIGGEAENYQREVEVDSAADVAAVAKAVVRVFREGFDYRGTRPIRAQLVHEGRSETKPTYDAFTPEDVAKVFAGLGYRVAAVDPDEGEDVPATIRCRKRGVETLVEFDEPAEGGNVYRRVRFSADVPLPDEERERLKNLPGAPADAEPVATASIVHAFGGGVTLDWLVARIRDWEEALAAGRRAARRRRRAEGQVVRETVH